MARTMKEMDSSGELETFFHAEIVPASTPEKKADEKRKRRDKKRQTTRLEDLPSFQAIRIAESDSSR